MVEFKSWPKIYRVYQTKAVITEKIDGTNACVIIQDGVVAGAQSRKRIITPDDDNYGFARWVYRNEEELVEKLGDGYHYGEWAGLGIQGNPLCIPEKRFFLFNTHRWGDEEVRPMCCDVVTTLYSGLFSEVVLDEVMNDLRRKGEAEKYIPEGVVVFFPLTNTMQKATFNNPEGKWNG